MANFNVRRKLALSEPLTQQQQQLIEQLEGIETLEHSGNRLIVRYDASQVQLRGIVETAQLPVANGRLNQMRYRYYLFTDANLAEESGHTPHCCNKLPR